MTVHILITWDIDPDIWIPKAKRRWALQAAMDTCHAHQIPATFYVTGHHIGLYQPLLGQLWSQGHELGCHGLTHGIEENYDRMGPDKQRLYLEMATEYVSQVSGRRVQAFRSPRVKTCGATQQILSDLGYRSDSSVCSQRMDVISSNLINTGWLTAPRRPYHPSRASAFHKGDLPIWQIPVSATLAPFISSMMQVVGVEAMKRFFDLLYHEARITGKPIVYLAHPTEFITRKKRSRKKPWRQHLKPEFFSPTYIRAHGLRARNLLYRTGGEVLLTLTHQLFSHMASYPDVQFTTMSAYVDHLEQTRL